MLIGAHVVIQSANPAADRAFLSDKLKLPSVDAGGTYVILGLPPSEMSVHLGREYDGQAFYFMCDDVAAFIGEMKGHAVACEPVKDAGWGLLTYITLPGGQKLGVYEPRHPHPPPMTAKKTRKPAKRGRKR